MSFIFFSFAISFETFPSVLLDRIANHLLVAKQGWFFFDSESIKLQSAF